MIFAIKPFEIHDGDGIRTTVFFKGCPLRCQWCHNPESYAAKKEMLFDAERCVNCLECTTLCNANIIRDAKHVFARESCVLCGKCEETCPQNAFEISGKDMSAEEIAEEVLKDEIFMKGSGGGVTFSGGEPLMQVDFCVEIAKLLKARDINIAIDTCCAVSSSNIDKIIPFADTFLIDIKAIDEQTHIKCTGASNQQILKNIKYVDSLNVPIEIRYPYVPSMNDGEVDKIAHFIKELKNVKCVRVLAYHNYADKKYERMGMSYPLPDVPMPTKEQIELVAARIRNISSKNVALY